MESKYDILLAVVFVVCLIAFPALVIVGMAIKSAACSNMALLPALIGVANLCLIFDRAK